MASIVSISPVSNKITLDEKGKGVFAFTVTSTLDAPIRVGVKILVANPEQQQWVQVQGDQERALQARETDQFTVSVRAPKGATPGKHRVRLLIYAVDQPGEEYTEGPEVKFEIPVKPVDSSIPAKKKRFPLWIVIASAVALLAIIGGIVAWIFIGSNGDDPEPEVTVDIVTVPDVSGLTEEAAAAKLIGAGLTVDKVRAQPATDKTLGTVISQNPIAGEEVDASTGITITLAAVDPDHKAKVCEQFAQEGLRQHQQNLDNSCGLSGAEWSSDFGYLYSRCDNAADYQAVSSRLNDERQTQLDACLRAAQDRSDFCAQYGETAVQQQKANSMGGCGFSGARWSTNIKGHADWCLALGDDYKSRADSEAAARSNGLDQCNQTNKRKQKDCEAYAKTAIKQQAKNLAQNCGYKGNRWQSDYDNHFNWCTHGNNYKAVAPRETRARDDELKRCASNRQEKVQAPCVMYQHANYRGEKFLVEVNKKYNSVGDSWNDQVSAVKVPDGCQLRVYQHADFKGNSKTFPQGSHHYIGDSWNDQISSVICSCK